ncbi:hypothetical protein FRX31_013922 [Thalictrum thalictroides]|uniref:Uncharacterized protein n=1 Tax=Thalictrum thalictroides TaxID=46969 RepID=A0A7J6WGN7_THATH|nr:hypothetical protein FRX31_013922 [Thalictrum thalictroides]
MGRVRRQVQAARERWVRERRDRRFTSIVGRFFSSVRRSMCEKHLDEFQSFRDGLHEVSTLITDAEPHVEELVFAFFPPNPARIRVETWREFAAWLRSDMGEPIREVCIPWCQFGIENQRKCKACRDKAEGTDEIHDEETGKLDRPGWTI